MRSKKELQSRLLTHAVVVTDEHSPFIIKNPTGFKLSTLPMDIPMFPVAANAEITNMEGDVIVPHMDIFPAARVSPRFLSGHKLIPVTARGYHLSDNKTLLVPNDDELHLYTFSQADEVVPNATRCLFIGLEIIRHESTAAFAFDRVVGEFVQVGSVSLTELLDSGGMCVAAIPKALRLTVGELSSLDKRRVLHGLNDEPAPCWGWARDKSAIECDAFASWDAQLGDWLDSVERSRRADRKPYSGAARLEFDSWKNGHPTLQLIAEVAKGEKVPSRERVIEHLQKCIVCCHSTLVRAIPSLSGDIDAED